MFRDDDDGYRDWLHSNPNGYVINIQRSGNPSDARLHRADCWTLTSQLDAGVKLAEAYEKICGDTRAELEKCADETIGESIQPCGHCLDGIPPAPTALQFCPQCGYELSATRKCPSCDED